MANTLTRARPRITAVWGGNLARTSGQDGRWLGIPTGHQNANAQFGTSADPDTSYTLSSTADDLGTVIWQSLHTIRITLCRIWHGQGYTTNTTHKVCLMRYDIDADGDLSNGVQSALTAINSNSDDYSHLRKTPVIAAVNGDEVITSDQVLIAMVMCVDDVNAGMMAKCVIEYREQ